MKELFRKTKKILIKICNIHHIDCPASCLASFFPRLLERPKHQTV